MYMCVRGLLNRLRSNRILQQVVDYNKKKHSALIFHGVTLLSDQWQLTGVHFYRTDRKYFIARAGYLIGCDDRCVVTV